MQLPADTVTKGTQYRIYRLNSAGAIVGFTNAICRNDKEAREIAIASLALGACAEVWSGARCLGQVFVLR